MKSKVVSTNRSMAYFSSLVAIAFAVFTAGDLVEAYWYYGVLGISAVWDVVWTAFFALLFAFVAVTLFLEKSWSRVVLSGALDFLVLALTIYTVWSAIDNSDYVPDLLRVLGIGLVPIACLLAPIAILHREHRRTRPSRKETTGDGRAKGSPDSPREGTR